MNATSVIAFYIYLISAEFFSTLLIADAGSADALIWLEDDAPTAGYVCAPLLH